MGFFELNTGKGVLVRNWWNEGDNKLVYLPWKNISSE